MRTYLIFLVLLFFLCVMGYAAYNYSQSERFGDETAHIIGGHFILEGKRLYQDMQFNHQPLPYFFSAFTELITKPKNLYLFIARQREMVFLFSAFWNIIYYFTFGPIFILFTILFEIGKYYFQGYKVLSETIATYPLIFMFGITIEAFIYKKKLSKTKLILYSFSAFIAGFSLLPLWIVIFFLYILLLYSIRNQISLWKYSIFPFFVAIVPLMYFVSFPSLIKQTVIDNVQYFLPNSGSHPSLIRMILLPFVSFVPPYHPSKILIALTVLFSGISLYFAHRKSSFSKYMLIFFIIMLTNFFRVDDFGFSNFHLLPWVGSLLVTEILWIKYSLNQSISIGKIIILSIFIFYTCFISGKQLFTKKGLATEYSINYSDSESFGNAISAMKQPGDRMLALPNDTLIYWVAKMNIPTHVLEYYPWVYHIPEYDNELTQLFKNNPPEFFVDTGLYPKIKTEEIIISILESKYQKLYHVGKPSKLFVLKSRMSTLKESQWKRLEEMLYTRTQSL